ncbi:hypothetical protein NDN08_006970 [Rhodosorus marinus]|uniref:HMA domain-containing protein n=1 Tax=Rhodosorus marinus TaxID=101924 RepID=A0AAV8UJ58_9RHOD|nr:hypothetical protein NDN08_006970 [Rhodosorus marinus]
MGKFLLEVQGMTCGSCVKRVTESLEGLNGVESAKVDLDSNTAAVVGNVDVQELIRAVAETGKQATLKKPANVVMTVKGMTCNGCVKRVAEALQKVRGVDEVTVSLDKELAVVAGAASADMLLEAVRSVGKTATLQIDKQAKAFTVVGVTKMTCNGCRKKIQQALEDVPGVSGVFVSLAEQLAVVEGNVDGEVVIAAIAEAGKSPTILYRSLDGDLILPLTVSSNQSDSKKVISSVLEVSGVREVRVQLEENFILVIGTDFSWESVSRSIEIWDVVATELFPSATDENLKSDEVVTIPQTPVIVEKEIPLLRANGQEESLQQTSPVSDESWRGDAGDLCTPLQSQNMSVIDDRSSAHLKVTGMTCSSCVGIVEKVLNGVPGVLSAKVNLMASRAAVRYDPTKVSVQTIVDAVNSSGYGAEKVEISSDLQILIRFFDGEELAGKAMRQIQRDYPQVMCSIVEEGKRSRWKSAGNLFDGIGPPRRGTILKVVIGRDTVNELAHGNVFIQIYEDVQNNPSLGRFEIVPASDPQMFGDRNPAFVLAQSERTYLMRFAAALLLSIPIFVINFLSEDASVRVRREFIQWVFATPVQFGCGWIFYRGAYYALKNRRANMDTLIALGSSVAYFFSTAVLLANLVATDSLPERTIFDTSVLLITLVLFGKWLETIAKRKAADGVTELNNLRPPTATFLKKVGSEFQVAYKNISVELALPGDVVRVLPGERCSVDGIIVAGRSSINESVMTGESELVTKAVEDSVFAGSVNVSNLLVVKAVSVGNDTLLSRVASLVDEAQTSRAKIEDFADRVSAVFVPVVVSLSAITTLIWALLCVFHAVPAEWYADEGLVLFSLSFGLAVLVVACPCALGLATPTVVMVATAVAARYKVLFKHGGTSLESTEKVDHVVFDKTGTLTMGRPHVSSLKLLHTAIDENDLLEATASVEEASSHPLAKAIYRFIREDRGIKTGSTLRWLQESEGCGVSGVLGDGRRVDVGRARWISEVTGGKELTAEVLGSRKAVSTAVVAIDGVPLAIFSLQDELRPEARAVVSRLQDKMKVTTHMVTGDSPSVAESVATAVNIPRENVVSEALPWGKIERVRELKGGNHSVAFIGDGINDAPAIAEADVGIALGAGTHIAMATASVVLVNSNLEDALIAIDIAKKAFKKVRMNFFWALCYNALALPIAAGALYPVTHTKLPPIVAASMMALSSVSVIGNSLLLRRYRPPHVYNGGGRIEEDFPRHQNHGYEEV